MDAAVGGLSLFRWVQGGSILGGLSYRGTLKGAVAGCPRLQSAREVWYYLQSTLVGRNGNEMGLRASVKKA